MAVDRRWPLALFRGAVPVALGLLFWFAMAGGEQERQQTLRAQPGADAASLEQRRHHNALIMAALREATETDENVAQRHVPWRNTRNSFPPFAPGLFLPADTSGFSFRLRHVCAGRGGRTGSGAGARFGVAAGAVRWLLELPLAQRRGAAHGGDLGVPGPAERHEEGNPPVHGRHRADHLRRRFGDLGPRHPRRPREIAAPQGPLRGGHQ